MKNVLIADDNMFIVEGINNNIDWKQLNAQVVEKLNDGGSIQKLGTQTIDLAIADIEMPGMDGFELANELIKRNPRIKIIFISAFDKFEYAKQALRIGAFDYIEKPIDYAYLTQKIKKVLEKIDHEQNVLEIIEKSRPTILANFFYKLLHLKSDEAKYQLEKYPEYLGLKLNFNYYTCIKIIIENAEEIKNQTGIQRYYVQQFDMQNEIIALANGMGICHLADDFNGFFCIIGADFPSRSAFQKEIYRIMVALEDKCVRGNKLNLIVGIGITVNSIWNISRSGEEANKVLENRFFLPQQKIFDTRDFESRQNNNFLIPEDQDNELVALLYQKNTAAMAGWIRELEKELDRKKITRNALFLRICLVLSKVINALVKLGVNTQDIEVELSRLYSAPDMFHSSFEIFSWLEEICGTACKKIDDSEKTYYGTICDVALNYILKNYENSLLSLNDIADSVNLSPAYLSALYKKHTGLNISEEITNVRIDTACYLLKSSGLSIKEISDKTGYSNQYYFSTSFKKKIGLSPSEYRELNQPNS
ncbi:MAG: response regulator [Spirochaetaceae bacterium]|jgi:two-component system response regulator YesN|nr:response regulator [Spirochaetaceae bacterium]